MKLSMPTDSRSHSDNETQFDLSEPSLGSLNQERISILLVDDEPKNLTVLETILDDPSYRLVRAVSADEALLALVKEEFALIVLDIQLPGMTGFELAQMVKQRKKTAGIPIIFLTAYYSEAEHVLEGYGSGAVDYLHKPVNPAILRSKVAVFAALHRTTRQTELANSALLAEITERRRVESQLLLLNNELEERVEQRTFALQDAHRRKDEFLATLAHELRNPLAPIRNSLQILKMSQVDTVTAQQITEMMERQVHHLVRLVDDLLDVSRVMGGKIELRKEKVELARIVADAVETAKSSIDEQGHQLEIVLPGESLLVEADPVRLIQVIGNILTNAAKYTEANGRIRLTGEREGNEIVLRVKDTGIGIASDMLPRIFELFMQVDQAAARSNGGLGIGLTLVKNLVEMHGGTVTANSPGLGKGSEFVVCLPLAANGANRHKSETDQPQSKKSRSHRLLVVDDNKDAAISLALLLQMHGHEVQVTHDGQSALELLTTYHPDLIFLDIGMPGMDGYEVARRIRQMPGLERIVLAAVTGWGQEEDRRRTTAAGFNHHMIKPADPVAIQSVLANLKPLDNASS